MGYRSVSYVLSIIDPQLSQAYLVDPPKACGGAVCSSDLVFLPGSSAGKQGYVVGVGARLVAAFTRHPV